MNFPTTHIMASILLILIASMGACGSGNAKCTGDIGSLTINPHNSQCTQKCECNNQNYTGDCIQGKCNSQERATCTAKGKITICVNHITKCQGRDICQAKGLNSKRLGDCICEQTAQPKSELLDECRTDKDCIDGGSCLDLGASKICVLRCTSDEKCQNFCKDNSEACKNSEDKVLTNIQCVSEEVKGQTVQVCAFTPCNSDADCPRELSCIRTDSESYCDYL